jgi:poly(ADP-ribose) glycohydrolase ARH3
LNEVTSFAKTAEMMQKLSLVMALIKRGATDAEAADLLGRTILAHDAASFAIYSFVTNPKSFKRCLYTAVLNGGDCDTLGAMACGMSGAYLGIEAIPTKWIIKLESRTYFENLARMMYKIKMGADDDEAEEEYCKKWMSRTRTSATRSLKS